MSREAQAAGAAAGEKAIGEREMTEDEAKAKNCPILRAAAITLVPHTATERPEGVAALDTASKCEASLCMMWRWSEEKDAHRFVSVVVDTNGDEPCTRTRTDRMIKNDEREGHCGLGGKCKSE